MAGALPYLGLHLLGTSAARGLSSLGACLLGNLPGGGRGELLGAMAAPGELALASCLLVMALVDWFVITAAVDELPLGY